MRAYASVTLDDEFVVHEMRVIDGPKGLFVAMPSRRASTGEFRDIAHPITAEARHLLQAAVLKAFAHASSEMARQAKASVQGEPAPTAPGGSVIGPPASPGSNVIGRPASPQMVAAVADSPALD
jgi:stage V sporulation protein G